jgi:hypothetical protein
MPYEEAKAHLQTIREYAEPLEVYFGTNESNYYSSGEQVAKEFSISGVSDKEIEVLIGVLVNYSVNHGYGTFPLNHILAMIEENNNGYS